MFIRDEVQTSNSEAWLSLYSAAVPEDNPRLAEACIPADKLRERRQDLTANAIRRRLHELFERASLPLDGGLVMVSKRLRPDLGMAGI